MNGIDKRRHTRVASTNLLNYMCIGDDGEPYQQGMGRTLNVSESGILLETYAAIDSNIAISIAIGIGEDLVDIQGVVVYLKQSGKDTYEAGIEFSQIKENERAILREFITAFKKRAT